MIEKYLNFFALKGPYSLIPSKKNNVYLIDNRYILKIYGLFGKKGYTREINILSKSSPPLVPTLYGSYKKEAILLEHINGKRLFDIEEDLFTYEVLDKLILWFKTFSKKIPGYIRGDSIPQNFILKDNGDIIGIDFEEARKGDILIDIAEFASFLIAWKKLSEKKRVDLALYFIRKWQEISHYDTTLTLKRYIVKFFRKFYFFRKDSSILKYIENIDLLIKG